MPAKERGHPCAIMIMPSCQFDGILSHDGLFWMWLSTCIMFCKKHCMHLNMHVKKDGNCTCDINMIWHAKFICCMLFVFLFFAFMRTSVHEKTVAKKTLVSRAQSCICIITWSLFFDSSWCNDSCNSNCFFNCCNVLSNDKFFVVCPFTRDKQKHLNAAQSKNLLATKITLGIICMIISKFASTRDACDSHDCSQMLRKKKLKNANCSV